MGNRNQHVSPMWKNLTLAAGLVGGLVALKKLFASPAEPFESDGRSQTAVVTGASSGIGAAYARQLAAAGYNLLLVARRAERLQALTEELSQRHGITANYITADLTVVEDVERVATAVAQIDDLALLVNNAGFGTRGYFIDLDLQSQLDMIHIHIDTPVRLTHAALPRMVERQHGAVINMSSIATAFPMPNRVNYVPSKLYQIPFSEALQKELQGSGVKIQALCTGFTHTEFHDSLGKPKLPAFLWMQPDEVVAESLAALNYNRVVVTPGWVNKMIMFLARVGLVKLMIGGYYQMSGKEE